MNAAADLVIAAARVWLGTPYVHQASVLGAGCDCLGLARGVWRDLHGAEPMTPPPYTRDWGEAGGTEVLAEAARRFLVEIPIAVAGPGALILFRMARNAPAKHCGIRSATGLIHAYEGVGVIEEVWSAHWARKATLWQQRMRGALSRLPMASGPWIWRPTDVPEDPAQMSLFEGMLP